MNPIAELQTKLGTEIPVSTRGILYLCELNKEAKTITVKGEALFDCAFEALECYANIPNPESQLVTNKTYNELISSLHRLHKDMSKEEWVLDLMDCL